MSREWSGRWSWTTFLINNGPCKQTILEDCLLFILIPFIISVLSLFLCTSITYSLHLSRTSPSRWRNSFLHYVVDMHSPFIWWASFSSLEWPQKYSFWPSIFLHLFQVATPVKSSTLQLSGNALTLFPFLSIYFLCFVYPVYWSVNFVCKNPALRILLKVSVTGQISLSHTGQYFLFNYVLLISFPT